MLNPNTEESSSCVQKLVRKNELSDQAEIQKLKKEVEQTKDMLYKQNNDYYFKTQTLKAQMFKMHAEFN